MAPIIGAAVGSYLTLRTYKKLSTNQELKWANAYEFVVRASPTLEDLEALITVVVDFEDDIHGTEVLFDRAVLSTWVPDGEPYDPTSFIVKPLTTGGARTSVVPLSLNYCLFLRREVNSGRSGKIFYRRVLQENDVDSPAGYPNLSNPAALTTLVDDALTASDFIAFMQGTQWAQLVMKSALPIEREVTGLTVAGARVIQYNNRYFDVP